MRRLAIAILVGCAGVSVASAQVPSRPSTAAASPVFMPRLVPNAAPAPPFLQSAKADLQAAARRHGATVRARHTPKAAVRHGAEIVCGTKMFRPSTELDSNIRIQADLGKGIHTRRIEPDCAASGK